MNNKTITIYELMGLIKDGQAPKKINFLEERDKGIWLLKEPDEIYPYLRYVEKDFEQLHLTFEYYICNNLLNTKLEILPEENNEWEDIEELNYTLPTKHEHGKLFYKDGHNNVLRQIDITILEKINQLIKNQKCLKERLDKDGK